MSVEDALFIFSMFGFSLLTFGFMGGYLRFFGELMAIWLMIAGLIVLSVGIIVLFVRNDAFIHDISELSIPSKHPMLTKAIACSLVVGKTLPCNICFL